tara:strand:- start:10858 stop:11283 length:426 start_codon:yes stop_codon:yes gene_type:complete
MEITISLQGITSELIYKYVSLFMMGTAYIPQIRLNMKNGTPMNDFSYVSLGMLITSGLLWTLYTYEQGNTKEAVASFFVTLNIIILVSLKIKYYIRSVREHYKTFGDPSDADPTKIAVAEIITKALNQNTENHIEVNPNNV